MSYKRSEKVELKPITIRFPPDTWDVIESMAQKSGINKTEFIRITLAGNLAHYLGTIRIIDEEQGDEIKKLIKELLGEILAVKIELHRIGVNFNQSVKLKQIERKYADAGMDVNALLQKGKDVEQIRAECKGFSQEDMDALMSRYEQATKQVGDILCHILT